MRALEAMGVGLLLAAMGGCAEAPEVGAARAAVQNGTPSSVGAVVYVADSGSDGSSLCAGAVVGDRWVVTPDFCTDGSRVWVVLEEDVFAGTPIEALRVHEGPAVSNGSAEVSIDLVELAEPLGVTPVELSEATPAVDDVYTMIGFGNSTTSADERTEGLFRITVVDEDTFTTEPEGDVASCYNDHTVFDPEGRLAGMNVWGNLHGTYDRCFGITTSVRVSFFRDFVESTIAAAADAGVPPADAGTSPPDGGAGTGDAGTSPPADDDGGCGCVAAGAPSAAPGAVSLALAAGLGLLLRRRRRRR